MNSLVSTGIILARTNFGEADRILTVLTPDYGKLRLMAKGVRRSAAKLAGSVELFSVSDVTFIRGRGDIGTLVSARLEKHYKNIVKDINRVNLGYEMLKLINKNTEDSVESEYFELLSRSLAELDDLDLPLGISRLYFEANLLKLAGHAPNLVEDSSSSPLASGEKYNFSASDGFIASHSGSYGASEIKFLRLVFAGNLARALARVENAETLASASGPLLAAMLRHYLRV